jgi:hypothetical protein
MADAAQAATDATAMPARLPEAQQAAQCLAESLGSTHICTFTADAVLGDLEFRIDHNNKATRSYNQTAISMHRVVGEQQDLYPGAHGKRAQDLVIGMLRSPFP